MAFILQTASEMQTGVASRFKARRLAMNLSQRELAERAGVAPASLKRFEREGLISLTSLLGLAMALGCLDDFGGLAAESVPGQMPQSLDDLLDVPAARRRATGKQGRKRGL